MRKLRLAYLVTHPIQYQAPLLRMVAAQPDIDLTAFFATDFSARSFKAHDFAQQITWDVPLLEGYAHEVLPRLDRGPPEGIEPILGFWAPLSHGFGKALDRGGFDALWIHGYARWHHWCAIAAARRRGIKVFLRDEATPISARRSALKAIAKRAFFAGLGAGVDGFLAIGTLNRRYYEQNGIDPARISLVPYAVDNAHFRKGALAAAERREETRAAWGLDFVVVNGENASQGAGLTGDHAKELLAAGADCVMLGSILAGTSESPGNMVNYQGRTFKEYRGMGSLRAMRQGSSDRYGQNASGKLVAEGVEARVPYKGHLRDVVFQLTGGLRSGMGYLGARTLDELRTRAGFVRITAGGLRESHAHDVVVTEEPVNYQTL